MIQAVSMIADSSVGDIRRIRTLGPSGTNCQAAAEHFAESKGLSVEVVLHLTLEEAIDLVVQEPDSALLGCVVYPDLHQLVFPYLGRMKLVDTFMFNTFNMVLAAREKKPKIKLVATHPAPSSLVDRHYQVLPATSNAMAAQMCRAHEVDACITTLPAAQQQDLSVILDHGPVPMGFTIHVPEH